MRFYCFLLFFLCSYNIIRAVYPTRSQLNPTSSIKRDQAVATAVEPSVRSPHTGRAIQAVACLLLLCPHRRARPPLSITGIEQVVPRILVHLVGLPVVLFYTTISTEPGIFCLGILRARRLFTWTKEGIAINTGESKPENLPP